MTKKSMAKKTSKKSVKYNPADWDESSTIEVNPEPRMTSGLSTSIRLPAAMVKKLRKIAEKKGEIGYQTLIKIWIAERLEEEAS